MDEKKQDHNTTKLALEALKSQEQKLLQEKKQELDVLQQNCRRYHQLWCDASQKLAEKEKHWNAQLAELKQIMAEKQEILDEYRYLYVGFNPEECKLEDLPLFRGRKLIQSVIWKAIWHTFAVVELETALTQTEFELEDDLTDDEIPFYYIVESDRPEMNKALDFASGKKKRTLYDLLVDEYCSKAVDKAINNVYQSIQLSRTGMGTKPAAWDDAHHDPRRYRWLCDHTCSFCMHLLYDSRYEEWEEHIEFDNPLHTIQCCPDCVDNMIAEFRDKGIEIPKALLKVLC